MIGEVGYIEKATNAQLDSKTANAGDANMTKYARDLAKAGAYHASKQGMSWCDMTVDWSFMMTFGLELGFKMTCQPVGKYGAGCTESANYYKKQGRWRTGYPEAGWQIFFSRDGGKTMYHTGIVYDVKGGRVYTIEGNTSSEPGVVPNGGAVAKKSYPVGYEKIAGYGVPNYDLAEEDDEMLSQEKFEQMFAEMLKKRRDNDASPYSAEAREWAISVGLFVGGGTLPDGSPNYMWADYVTREQLATVLYKYARILGKA